MSVPVQALLPALVVVHLVVDQIDGGVAAVEWNGTDIAHLPVDLLPADVSEGDRLVLKVRRRFRRAQAARTDRRAVRSGANVNTGRVPEESQDEQEGKP